MSKFFPTPSEFQELCTSKRIGNAKEVDSLFILEEEPKNVEKAPWLLQCESSTNWEWNKCGILG